MSNFIRTIKKNRIKKEENEFRSVYNKKPKEKCPKCKRKSLFYKNKDDELYCIRCNEKIK